MKIILASGSPRRRELLAHMGVEFAVVPSKFDEQLDDARSAAEVAEELALGKAEDVAKNHPDAYVIGSDTIVKVNGRQLAKPRGAEEAHAMLRSLADAGETSVTTSLVVVRLADGFRFVGSDTTRVKFKPYNQQAILDYIATGDPFDKAGGYGIQSGADRLIDRIEGQYDTVVGLPTHLLAQVLRELGVAAKPVGLTPPVPQILGN